MNQKEPLKKKMDEFSSPSLECFVIRPKLLTSVILLTAYPIVVFLQRATTMSKKERT